MNPDLPRFLTLSPVIPVVTLRDARIASELARALLRGGIGVIEVTLRHAEGLKAIAAISRDVPEMLVGAGTVLSAEDLRGAVQAGAGFAVSPGSTAGLRAAAREVSIPWLPAVATPSELMEGLAAGYRNFKFFPATAAGGIAMLQSLQAPFPEVKFCATGGIDASNARDFLHLTNVVCIGGSWLVPRDALERRDFARIEALASAAATLREAAG